MHFAYGEAGESAPKLCKIMNTDNPAEEYYSINCLDVYSALLPAVKGARLSERFVNKRQWGLAMSERSRLPDSLKWRVVEWMEMELSQVDAAKRLNVSRSVVHTISGINIKPKHLHPEDMFQADHELEDLQETVLSLFQPEGEEGIL
ncbi:uncharacterized protein TNCV_2239111 [Trichonephila clavipes]|nr:uncharacterized protein TNCV_2239111 [Trichonephila clavipes]